MERSTGRSKARAVVWLCVVVSGFVLAPASAGASGGGGCGGPVTDEAGSSVALRGFCFSPTILRVAPGESVTFTNRDPVPHNVIGANGTWGSWEGWKKGRGDTYRFEEPGVYPYVCTYHPGMVGAVVVGDGIGGAFDTVTGAGPVTSGATPLVEVDPVSATSPVRDHTDAWVGFVISGAAAGFLGAVMVAIRYSRRRSLA